MPKRPDRSTANLHQALVIRSVSPRTPLKKAMGWTIPPSRHIALAYSVFLSGCTMMHMGLVELMIRPPVVSGSIGRDDFWKNSLEPVTPL